MIPDDFIQTWRKTVPWQLDEQQEEQLKKAVPYNLQVVL